MSIRYLSTCSSAINNAKVSLKYSYCSLCVYLLKIYITFSFPVAKNVRAIKGGEPTKNSLNIKSLYKDED